MRLGSRRTIFQVLDCLTAKLYVHSNTFLLYICFYLIQPSHTSDKFAGFSQQILGFNRLKILFFH
jgi:hypothetical protein